MTHRTDMVALQLQDSFEEAMQTFSSTGYSRIPVYGEDIDNIKGILYVKDLIDYCMSNRSREFKIEDYLRDAMFVYENLKCDDLLPMFQKNHVQIAIVLDEYGGTYGLITMEDLLESIVGNIQDEFDEEEETEIEKINDSHFIVDGATLIEEVSEMIHVHLDDSENDTIGGLLMDKLGHVPAEDEHAEIKIGNATFKIISMDEQSIDKIDIVVENSGEENGSTSKDTSN